MPKTIREGALTSTIQIEPHESPKIIHDVLHAAGAELVIVSASIDEKSQGIPIDSVLAEMADVSPILISTTSLAHTSSDAISIAQMLRKALGINLVKLDVRPDKTLSQPDNLETFRAAKILVQEGFEVIPMIFPDPIIAIKLQEVGCKALRLTAGHLKSGLGITNLQLMLATKSAVTIPCIGEGGIATVSDVALVMQSGFDAVLVNSAIAKAGNPRLMASAMRLAVTAARACYLAQRMPILSTPVGDSN